MNDEIERQLRAGMREQIALLTPPQHVDEIVDLAFHAAKTAVDQVMTVTGRASDPRIMLAAIGPAYGLLVGMAESRLNGVRSFAEQNGMAAAEFRIEAHP